MSSSSTERVTRQQRAMAVGQGLLLQGCTVWLTGKFQTIESIIILRLD